MHPDNADLIAVRGEGDGVVFSEDGGESWRLVCAAVPETDEGEAVEMEHISGGQILFSSFRGVQQVGSDGCGWSIPASTLDGPTIGDLRRHPGMASTFFAATKQGGRMNGVYRSDDEGASWAPLGPQLSGFFSYLRVAPSNPDRMYVARTYNDEATGMTTRTLRVSDDGGDTWTASDFPTDDGVGDGPIGSFGVVHVDPDDPDRILAALVADDVDAATEAVTVDRIKLSEDGGQTWQPIMDVGDLGGVAATPDGSRIWIGDSQGGLWLSEDDGASFQRVHPDPGSTPALDVTALSYSHDQLWVGSLLDEHGFTLGVSEDGGETIRRLMVWNDVKQLASCPDDEVTSVCADTRLWSQWQKDFLVESEMQITPKELGDPPIWPPQGGAPADAGTPAEDDAGAVGAGGAGGTGSGGNGSGGVGTGGSARAPDAGSSSPVGSDGCSCVVAEQPRSAPWSTLGWVLLSMLALAYRRKRAR